MSHPMQPVEWDDKDIIRFKSNAIVRYLLDWAQAHGNGLNQLALIPFSREDWTQFAQLIGYSVSGAGDLDYFDRTVLERADESADKLLLERKKRDAEGPKNTVVVADGNTPQDVG